MNSYSMKETMNVASLASKEIENFLLNTENTVDVINVENDRYFQKKDIDLLWVRKNKNNKNKVIKVEVKGDRYHYTGNFFIETISNANKCSPGCFLYSEADYFFYYFVYTKELYILPLKKTRNWFLKNQHRFELKRLSTNIKGKGMIYKSYGKTVPIDIVLKEVKGTKSIKL